MNFPVYLLFKTFVTPFYKENAGAFIFVFTMLFFVVSKVDGAELFAYHYSLITAMLTSPILLLLVFFAWFLYARKYVVFVSNGMRSPQSTFLQIYACLSKARQFRLFLAVEAGLLMPILLYACFIVAVGYQQHLYTPVLLVILYLLVTVILSAAWHVYLFNHPAEKGIFPVQKPTGKGANTSTYSTILMRFIGHDQKAICVGIKVFTCGMLYLIARNNTGTDYDVGTPFLFFNFGILAHGILVYRIREFEETYLSFYRGLPVSLWKRGLQYVVVYGSLLIPEFITIAMLLPVHLQLADAISISLTGFSMLLFMNSIMFLYHFSMKEFVIILLLLFSISCICLITIGFTALYLLLFIAAIFAFFTGYHTFERSSQN